MVEALMSLEATVRNGKIIPDSDIRLEEGTRLRLEVIDDYDDLDELLDKLPEIDRSSLPDDHPDAPYNREKELAILRESIAEMKAGGGVPFEQFMAKLRADLDLPELPRE
jgi:hypothetical protein